MIGFRQNQLFAFFVSVRSIPTKNPMQTNVDFESQMFSPFLLDDAQVIQECMEQNSPFGCLDNLLSAGHQRHMHSAKTVAGLLNTPLKMATNTGWLGTSL